MAPYPDDRYQSAREFAEDIEAFRSGRPVAAAVPVEDSDATRRTTRRSGEGAPTPDAASEATRRTTRPSPVPSTSQPAKRRWVFRATVRTIGILGLAGVSYASWVAVSNYFLYKHGQELSRQVESEQLTDPEQIWARWTELSQGNPSSLLLYGPRKVVKQKFVAEADRVIDTFRNNGPQQPHEKDWERARMMASHALGVDPDEGVRGKLRLAEGHLARINGAAHRSAPELNHAVELFQEAQRLLPKSPDPQLGLARVYYSPKDLEKADNALEEARRRGYPLGNPQKLQLADRYRDRGDRLWADSRNLNGLPPEKDQLQRVAADYRRALEIYQEIAPYGNANAAIDKLHSNLDSVLFRTMQIDTISTIKSIWR
jgi:tetratricopeptide (TPR) repeat protein